MTTNFESDPTDQIDETRATDEARPSRRRFFAMGASAAAALAATRTADAQTSRGRPDPFQPSTPTGAKVDASIDWKDPLLRLVRRVTMGMSPDEVTIARRLGYAGYLNYHLAAASIDDSAVEAAVTATMPMTNWTYMQLVAAGIDGNEAMNQLSDSALYRAAFSKRQLKERMVEFWTDHFTISMNKVGVRKITDDRDVIRANALGNYKTLLKATSKSGAMLVYLDQNRSTRGAPNQNYAREIMELHTLGVDNGYTQNDVAELSRILTGWTVAGNGDFTFSSANHDNGAKTFLGRSFPGGTTTSTAALQLAEGEAAIDMLLSHPATAKYISLKMARWLLAYTPPQSVVDAAAAVFTSTNGDIAAMVRSILSAKNLTASPAKYKRPFHLAASALRGMGAQVANVRSIRARADQMGQPMFYWEQPNGYPDRVDWWSGLVVGRWSFMADMANRNTPTQTRVDTAPFRMPDTADGVVAQIDARMFGGELPASLRTELLTYLRGGTYSDARVRETLSLAGSSNQFQWF